MGSRYKRSKLVLHLSKPWEVGEALGWSPLPALVDQRDEDRWLVELEKPFRFQQSEFRYFVVSPRLDGWHLAEADSTEVPCKITPIDPETGKLRKIPESLADDLIDMAGSVTDYRH